MLRTRLPVLLAALFSLAFTLSAIAPAARAAEAGSSGFPPRFVFLLNEPRFETASDTLKVLVPGHAGTGEGGAGEESTAVEGSVPAGPGSPRRENSKLVGGSFFASGVFLCGWGIASWQFDEDQCCPTRNTENVLKIIVGVVLINAGLAYLLGVLG